MWHLFLATRNNNVAMAYAFCHRRITRTASLTIPVMCHSWIVLTGEVSDYHGYYKVNTLSKIRLMSKEIFNHAYGPLFGHREWRRNLSVLVMYIWRYPGLAVKSSKLHIFKIDQAVLIYFQWHIFVLVLSVLSKNAGLSKFKICSLTTLYSPLCGCVYNHSAASWYVSV